MLSPREEDDDDNHLCIKCNTTIMGLDNYVKHRKERCQKKTYPKQDLPPIDPLDPTYSLGADVFFQSLELQSSVKKTSLSRMTPPIPISKASERKTLDIPSSSKDLPRMSPLESNLRGEDWIGGHKWRIEINEDNQTKLINAVASISGAIKKDIPTSSYNIAAYNDYKGHDDSDDSEDLDDDEEISTVEKWKPPLNYTGGKWRPASPDEWIEPEHLGGKWRPIMLEALDRDEDYDAPPPGHTKGKWVPGAHEKTQIMQTTIQTKGCVQYWCGPCNRRLGTRAIYEKHLVSNMHMKKVLPEHELEFSGHLERMKCTEKRSTRLSRSVDDNVFMKPTQMKIKNDATQTETDVTLRKKKRKRKPYYVQCSGCRSRVRLHLMGKHLISHYHFRKATQTQSSEYQQLIFDNMDAIVHQSPFQCSPCKFYTNWLPNFIQHWHSQAHTLKIASMDGRYWCSFCKFECETSQEMLDHMSSSEHNEVIAVINRSMPIIIRKRSVFHCETCFLEFRYNIEAKKHSAKTGHRLTYSATDSYQEIHTCEYCKEKYKSSITLAGHLKSKHKHRAYLCLVCSQSFNTSIEAKQHRQTSEHRVRRKENMQERGISTKNLSKKCPYCAEAVILKNVLELKNHIRRVHPEIKKKCPTCGMEFIFSQEVTRHVRANACQYVHPPRDAAIVWNCSKCLFTTDSQAECFFHEVLHTTPITEAHENDGSQKNLQKYSCPLCSKVFSKSSLRQHLRQHTFERPYACLLCSANFTRQSSLVNHFKKEHQQKDKVQESAKNTMQEEPSTSMETSCGLSKNSLGSNLDADMRRCEYENCNYIGATPTQLARHSRRHGNFNIKHHVCPYCPFKTDQASHMKRHMVCHAGIKPYACPHCQFTCGSLENLRKHVLRSGRHPGLYLYACKSHSDCNYKTNMATELRSHLTSVHAAIYNVKTAQEAVRKHLMIEVPHE